MCVSVRYFPTTKKDPLKWQQITCTKWARSHNLAPSPLLFCSGGVEVCSKQSTLTYSTTSWHTSALQLSTFIYCKSMKVWHGTDGEYPVRAYFLSDVFLDIPQLILQPLWTICPGCWRAGKWPLRNDPPDDRVLCVTGLSALVVAIPGKYWRSRVCNQLKS